jgi:hypothetical protein
LKGESIRNDSPHLHLRLRLVVVIVDVISILPVVVIVVDRNGGLDVLLAAGRFPDCLSREGMTSKISKELSDEDIVVLVDITEYDEVFVGVGKSRHRNRATNCEALDEFLLFSHRYVKYFSSELRSHCNIFGPIRTTANQSKFTNSISRTARHHTRYSYLAKKYSS